MKLVVILLLAVVLAVLSTADADEHHPSYLDSPHIVVQGGDIKSGKKYSDHKHVKKAERKLKQDLENGRKGYAFKDLHTVEDGENGGSIGKFHTGGSHKSSKKSGGGSAHGLKYVDGSKRKKDNQKKGFREKYHKDQAVNHDSFFSNSQKSGEYKVFGKGHEKHSAKASAKKLINSRKRGKSEGSHGKSAKKTGGHSVVDKKGHKKIKSSKGHHKQGASSGKKAGSSAGKQYQYDTRLPDGPK